MPEEDEDELTLGEDGLTLGEGELTLGEEQPTSPEEAAANVAASLKAFEAAVDALDSPGIGHNNPPEAIADAALTPEDIADTRSTIEALKDEIAAPIASSANLQALSDKIKALAKKVGAWLAKKADAVLNVALGAAGQATYSWAVDKMFPPQHHFFEIATKLAQDIGHWVALLPPPF
ncbi:MAG: hypothetical protein E5W38_22495 [Mesorhizobium sp.]|nr:MAG: hypothetical protein E5W38_22495 [Mesorhizobium sp.]